MSREPLVSSIIIFLDAEEFIAEAIASVFAQTYRNWELLLVDDGSRDGSTEIALQCAARYPEKVRYIEHEGHANRGMSASRNLGVKTAKGEYIAFLDADDVWLPNKLQEQVAILESNPRAGMVYGATRMWYSWTGIPDHSNRDFERRLGVEPDSLIDPPTLLTRVLRNEADPPGTCSLLVRRDVVESVGGFEESFRGLYEDQAFFAKVCLKVPVFVAGRCWDKYRQHPDSSCSVATRTGETRKSEQKYLDWLAGYLSKQGLEDTELWRTLRKDAWPERHPLLSRLPGRVQQLAARLRDAYLDLTGKRPRIAYEPDLVPPFELMRREGIEVLEEWFRWAEEWSMLLRVYGRITRDSRVLEIGCGLGRIAFPLRFIISSSGSYDGFDCCRHKIAFLEQTFHKTYPHFRFNWADIRNGRYNPAGEVSATRYSFPYADASFDIAYAASVFTHILPEAALNYFREAGRVLKPGGRCLFSFFLLDNYRPGQARPLGFARPAFNFDHSYEDYGPDFSVVRPDNPEFMTAYSLRLIERFAAQSGLELLEPPLPGLWSGSFASWVGSQDLIVLRKRG